MPSGLNGLECLLDFSRGMRVFSWNPHLSTKAAFFKIIFHWFFIMFIVFSLFSRCFSLFFIDLSLFWRWCLLCSFVFHYLTMFFIDFLTMCHWRFIILKMLLIIFQWFFIIFKMVLINFNYVALIVQCVYMCFIIFHWFFNALKIFFIMFHYIVGLSFAIYMHILYICSTWKTRDGPKFEILEFWGLQD